MDQKILVR